MHGGRLVCLQGSAYPNCLLEIRKNIGQDLLAHPAKPGPFYQAIGRAMDLEACRQGSHPGTDPISYSRSARPWPCLMRSVCDDTCTVIHNVFREFGGL
jgi:hypothetical protein